LVSEQQLRMETAIAAKKELNLIVSFRGSKATIPLKPGTTVHNIKSSLAESINRDDDSIQMQPHEIKLLLKGKVLASDVMDVSSMPQISKSKKDIKLIAMGISSSEKQSNDDQIQEKLRSAPRIRNDLTPAGRRDIAQRRKIGRKFMAEKLVKNTNIDSSSSHYKFHRIETLPMLPEQAKAKQILTELANDPGILACMAKHQFTVGCLAEMYPEGKVGESEVCVMGLNQNKGQKIFIRLRTDDLRGFRKILSIRKVLFHEMAHNVHSEHNGDFFQLMRQIEKDCNEMNWTKGTGQSLGGRGSHSQYSDEYDDVGIDQLYIGGTGRLGGSDDTTKHLTRRELMARAAMTRISTEEEEIEMNCGCGAEIYEEMGDVENPSQSTTTLLDMDMDESKTREND